MATTKKRWGGLSTDPEKRAKQLAGLAKSNPHVAAKLAAATGADGATRRDRTPSHRTDNGEGTLTDTCRDEHAPVGSGGGGGLPVHDYVEDPDDAAGSDPAPERPGEPAGPEPEPEPVAGADPAEPEPEPRRRGGLGEFFDGLARGY